MPSQEDPVNADYFRTLARYNAWANRRLFDACLALPEDAYRRSRPAFFGSIHATLNHILVGDRLWMARIEGVDDAGITRLDQILHQDRDALWRARQDEDARIRAYADGLGDAALGGVLAYANTAGRRFETPLPFVLGHLFNHATHHRGQVHDMLTQVPVEPPALDLIYYLRDRPSGHADAPAG
jgi:uncharacterized damage-inducible protein DinB